MSVGTVLCATPDVGECGLGKNVCVVLLCSVERTRKEASKGAIFVHVLVPQTPLLCSWTWVAKLKASYFVSRHVVVADGRFCTGLSPWRVIRLRRGDTLETNGAHQTSARVQCTGTVD